MARPDEESTGAPTGAADPPAREDSSALRHAADLEAVDILEQLRRYGEYEARVHSEVSRRLGLGGRDVQALRYLTTAHAAGRIVRQKDLSSRLAITGASVSALVDRLVREGYVERTPHPGDRRSVAVLPTPRATEAVRQAYERTHREVFETLRRLSPEDRTQFAALLRRINRAARPSDRLED